MRALADSVAVVRSIGEDERPGGGGRCRPFVQGPLGQEGVQFCGREGEPRRRVASQPPERRDVLGCGGHVPIEVDELGVSRTG